MANQREGGDRPNPDDNPPHKGAPDANPPPPKKPLTQPSIDALEDSDSAVDLGQPAIGGSSDQPVDLSGVSVIEWAALVEEPRSDAPAAEPAKFDSPSDHEILAHATPPPGGGAAGQAAMAVDAVMAGADSDVGGPAAKSGAGDPDSGPPAPPPEVVLTPDDGSAVNLGFPGEPPVGVGSGSGDDVPAAQFVDDSGVDLVAEDVADEVVIEGAAGPRKVASGSDSSVDLEAEARKSGYELPAVAAESGIDLVAEDAIEEVAVGAGPPPSAVQSDADVLLDVPAGGSSSIAESGVDVLEDAAAGGSSSPSSIAESGVELAGDSRRDLIAEAVESGVDLLQTKKQAAAASDEVDLAAVADEHSSAVDLGAPPPQSLLSPPGGAKAPASGIGSGLILEDAHDSGVIVEDVAGPASDPKRPTSISDMDIDLAAGPAAAAAAAAAAPHPADVDVEEAVEEAPAPKARKKAPAVVEDETEVETPKKPERRRGRAGALVGGAVLGTLVGAGACVGLLAGGVVPNEYLNMIGVEAKKAGGVATRPGVGPKVEETVASVADRAEMLRVGDFERLAKIGGIDKIDESKAEELVWRAEARWLMYLKRQGGKDLKADAPEVKQALADLTAAVKLKSPDALYQRGQIYMMTGRADDARKDFREGVAAFGADPLLKERFETALDVVDLPRGVGAAGRRDRDLAAREALLLHLLLLQAPGDKKDKPGDKPAAPPEEAGFRFWQAVKQARAGDYDKALGLLAEARKRHDARRFLLLRKPQNPVSDPTEEIFLRACDELRAAWTMQKSLRNPAELAKLPEVEKLLTKERGDARAAGGKAVLDALAADLAKGTKVASPADLTKAVAAERTKAIEAERMAAANKVKEFEGMLTTAKGEASALKKKFDQAAEDLKKANDLAATRGGDLKKAQARETELKKSLDSATDALKEVGKEVAVDLAVVTKDPSAVVKKVRDLVKVKDPKLEISKLQAEHEAERVKLQAERDAERAKVAAERLKLKQRWQPEEMLAFWVPILQKERGRKDLADKALLDAGRVASAKDATALQKGQADLVRGLALRNQDKFAEAKAALEKARPALAEQRQWQADLKDALAEVSDPAAYFAAQAAALEARGQTAQALALLKKTLAATPGKKGALQARVALLGLEQARAKGPVSAADPAVAAAKKDADAAAAEGLAEGHYAAGRIAEELGQYKAAVASYRNAVKAAGADDTGRYSIALARVLLKAGAEGEARRDAPAKGPVAKRAAAKPGALDFVALLVTLGVQAPLTGREATPASREAEKLADEVLAKGDKVPFDVRAQALAIKGLHTRALEAYATGLRDQGLLAPAHANALLELVAGHPGLKRPDARTVPDPGVAERHYGAGLNFFFARRYADAEKELLAAVENDNTDARYFYFLGLARLAQGKREAYEDLDAGAALERSGRPDAATVSAALERVQGPMRRVLNDVRKRPVEAGK